MNEKEKAHGRAIIQALMDLLIEQTKAVENALHAQFGTEPWPKDVSRAMKRLMVVRLKYEAEMDKLEDTRMRLPETDDPLA